jgi:hypothetical protein
MAADCVAGGTFTCRSTSRACSKPMMRSDSSLLERHEHNPTWSREPFPDERQRASGANPPSMRSAGPLFSRHRGSNQKLSLLPTLTLVWRANIPARLSVRCDAPGHLGSTDAPEATNLNTTWRGQNGIANQRWPCRAICLPAGPGSGSLLYTVGVRMRATPAAAAAVVCSRQPGRNGDCFS